MKRPYNDTFNNNYEETVLMFIGNEVEKSVAYNEKTLFVVGLQNPQLVIDEANNNAIRHIYLGANQSFNGSDIELWVNMITYILNQNFLVTFDFDVQYVDLVGEFLDFNYSNFIPMISVKIPHIKQLGYNACLKIDDIGFNKSNPGVWCHDLSTLTTQSSFTPWFKYQNDQIINLEK